MLHNARLLLLLASLIKLLLHPIPIQPLSKVLHSPLKPSLAGVQPLQERSCLTYCSFLPPFLHAPYLHINGTVPLILLLSECHDFCQNCTSFDTFTYWIFRPRGFFIKKLPRERKSSERFPQHLNKSLVKTLVFIPFLCQVIVLTVFKLGQTKCYCTHQNIAWDPHYSDIILPALSFHLTNPCTFVGQGLFHL